MSKRKLQDALSTLEQVRGGIDLAGEVLDQLARSVGKARDAREAFLRRSTTGKVQRVQAPDPTDGPLFELGRLTEVGYTAHKGQDKETYEFIHRFQRPLPRLAANKAGRLVIVGGDYVITPNGIEH